MSKYTFTDEDNMTGGRPRQIYWKELQVAVNEVSQKVENLEDKPIGLKGQVCFIEEDKTDKITLDNIVKVGDFVENLEELGFAQKKTVSMEEIFNEWHRFSHDGSASQPANSSEINSWSYDLLGNRVECLINSVTHIGFVSNDKFDQYTHEVRLSSTNKDNDMIGVVIAYNVDQDGREHTLTAVRMQSHEGHMNVGSETPSWAIVYNYLRSDAKVIADGTDNILADGKTWNSYPLGTKIKITRDRDLITAITTQIDSSDFVPESLLAVDLASDPVLGVFRGASSYGYSCHSQPGSTFSDIIFNDPSNTIFDISTGDTWSVGSNGEFVKDDSSSIDQTLGRVLINQKTKKGFFLTSSGKHQQIFQSTELKRMSFSLADAATKDIDTHQIFEYPVNARDLNIEIRRKEKSSSNPLMGMYVKDQAGVDIGINDRVIRVQNVSGGPLDLEILIRR